MPILKAVLRATLITVLATVLLVGAYSGIRWARRGGTSARMMASALMLVLGLGVVVKPPQQAIEEAREDKGRKGGEGCKDREPGDPPG